MSLQVTPSGDKPRKRYKLSFSTGTYVLGKTVGQGSIGKVKLVRHETTGELGAVKVIARGSFGQDSWPYEDAQRLPFSRDLAAHGETDISSLLSHPFIVNMRDMTKTDYHWYLLFEYVSGGQMLDYIINHGRLKEKQARRFARQLGSALDYCHKQNIVHRNIKIENILISKSGDIKLVDFCCSSVYSRDKHSPEGCRNGALYFHAPEVLAQTPYVGPEVDVWSFGIVLYVLVCGKVPFDGDPMELEYPAWLTTDCKALLALMLRKDPTKRATIDQVLDHPWMLKRGLARPDSFIPHRSALKLPLDTTVVERMSRMASLNLGSVQSISDKLRDIIESPDYIKAASDRGITVKDPPAISNFHLPMKRDIFRCCRRQSEKYLRTRQFDPNDHLAAFHPLVSIYYLTGEKMEREQDVMQNSSTTTS